MTPIAYAQKYLGQYKVKGDEIIPLYCPFCFGGQNHDKGTFALNMENATYNCKRGSCGVAGHLNQLLREKGEVYDRHMDNVTTIKEYKEPEVEVSPAQKKVEEYISLRGISRETWEKRGVGEVNGNVAFPYHENGQLVLVKYRKPKKYKKGDGQKAWREEGGKPVFWGMDECDPEKPLIIVEGEFDALALDECGVENVVSVPSGSSDLECVNLCWDWLNKFKKVIIWPDNDKAGLEMMTNLIQRIGAWRCWVVETEHKDPNATLHHEGKDGTLEVLSSAREIPIAGLVRLSQVKPFDPLDADKIQSCLSPINSVFGGYMMGLLTVITGINGSGKSTFIGQELINAVNEGRKVCVYSGELPAAMFKFWIDLQAAGQGYVYGTFDPDKGEKIYRPKPEVVQPLQEWYHNKFFLYDSFGGVKEERLLDVFEYAFRRYGCKLFVVDNLMTMLLDTTEKDFYRRQSNFVGKLKEFAHTYGVHVILVAHPRKTEGRLNKMDVMGSGDITNRADNVFSIHRHSNGEAVDGVVDIFKNRIFGKQDIEIEVNFDEPTKRFYLPTDKRPLEKVYNWNSIGQPKDIVEESKKIFQAREVTLS